MQTTYMTKRDRVQRAAASRDLPDVKLLSDAAAVAAAAVMQLTATPEENFTPAMVQQL